MKIQWEIEKAEYIGKLKASKKANPLDPESQIQMSEAESIPMVYKDSNGVVKENWQINY